MKMAHIWHFLPGGNLGYSDGRRPCYPCAIQGGPCAVEFRRLMRKSRRVCGMDDEPLWGGAVVLTYVSDSPASFERSGRFLLCRSTFFRISS
jgi:hypothetical protein